VAAHGDRWQRGRKGVQGTPKAVVNSRRTDMLDRVKLLDCGICEVSPGIADSIHKIEVGEQRLRGEGGRMPMPILEEDSTDESKSIMAAREPKGGRSQRERSLVVSMFLRMAVVGRPVRSDRISALPTRPQITR
jgi:hypothetical protein